jgi:hypothetical protein
MRTLAFVLLLLTHAFAVAQSYAPLADISKIDKTGVNVMAMRLVDASAPDAGAVGVAAYPGAKIVYMSEFAQIREGRYQEVKIVTLYTSDSIDIVTAHYKKSNPNWTWMETSGGQLYPALGAAKENLPGSSANLMSGPRVSITDVDRESHPLAMEIKAFMEFAPGSRTGIKIEYPGNNFEIVAVDESVIDNGMQRCVAQETARLQETVGPTFPASMPKKQRAETIARFAVQQCAMLRQSCENEPEKSFCQRLLRLYEN